MASTVAKNIALKGVRTYAAQTAAAQQTNYSLPYHQPQVTKLPSGTVVASLENNSPIASVSISFKAGARYESPANAGVSHVTRVCSGLGTEDSSAFKITRLIQQLGGTVVSENGREHMRYTVHVNRDHLETCIKLIGDVAAQPSFKSWEVGEQLSKVKLELENRLPISFALDALHNAAFRQGLGNSIFVPDYSFKAATSPSVLKDFHSSTHSADRMAVSGYGVEHNTLVSFAKSLNVAVSGSAVSSSSSYKGGDNRQECGGNAAYLAVAGQGAKIGHADSATFAVSQFLLGVGPSVKYGNSAVGKLANLLTEAGGSGNISALNVNYSDNGLFGFYLEEDAKNAGLVSKAIVKGLRSLKVSDSDIKVAKVRAKAAVAIGLESQDCSLEDMGLQALFTQNYLPLADIHSAIDGVTSASVKNVFAKTFGGKLSVGAVGALGEVPYSDEF